MSQEKNTELKGDLFLLSDNKQAFAMAQIELLTAIKNCGSISAAAKQAGISYKTAWDRIDAMNNMSEQPLVVRVAGGAKGGGSQLTRLGEKIIDGFDAMQQEHQNFIARMGSKLHSLQDVANFIRSGNMQTSARNQFRGQITRIIPGAVNAEVVLELSESQTVTAIITNDSLQQLNLKTGSQVIALVKASWVLLSKETGLKTSARNQLTGTITRICEGAVNSDITVDLGAGKSISAVITHSSCKEMGLQQGDNVCAFFKASNVILMAE
ncbi:TOBE domain-containing protein [Thalassomonas viridans]|uniref:TOBE domain-containing protein n=1 Tax=Thalassomonas viridans TaxID=137584 RepID=A0AAE9Z8T5_9GAMM|nr:TOBE domain-containing protein [Thalassomonas viridans]WDE08876.1 TOBE domain-containing protein [Thalassomonas viridans]